MDENKQAVLMKCDEIKDEIVETLRELVRIPSISLNYPGINQEEIRGGEGRCNEVVARYYRSIGCQVDLWEEEVGRANCVGVLKGSTGGRSMILNAHIDTVPPGNHADWMWNDPFSGKVVDGKIYGLGSLDDKGGVVAGFAAARAIKECGLHLKGDLILESVVGEETMDNKVGVSATVGRGYRADAAIVSEPTSYPEPLTISPASPGLLFLEVNCKGVATHPGIRCEFVRPGGKGEAAGVNAVEKGALMLQALQRLEYNWGFSKTNPFFRPGFFTIHPGVIIGGPPGPLVPFIVSTYCRIEALVWFPPQETQEAIRAEVEDYLQKSAVLDPWLAQTPPEISWRYCWPPFQIAEGHPLIQTCADGYETAARSQAGSRLEAKIHGFSAVCDATYLSQAGIPSIVFGPGDVLNAHRLNENLPVDELILAAKTLAMAAMDWCGVE